MSQVLIVRCDMDGSKAILLKLRVLSIKMYFWSEVTNCRLDFLKP